MSENKYIIDKDSLTGIADVVRDKLGEGSSIDDPGKGYYPVSKPVSIFSVESFTSFVGPQSTSTEYWCVIDDCSLYFNKPFKSVEVSWRGDIYAQLTINGQSYSGEKSKTVDFNNLQTYLSISSTASNNGYSPLSYSFSNIIIKLKDENGNYLIPKQNQLSYTRGYSTTYTTNFQSALVPTPIPMSLTDINNNISTYLTSNAGGGGTLETWNYLCTKQTYVSLPSDFSIENLKDVFFPTGTYQSGVRAACGLYKDSVGKPVSLKDQGIALPSSYNGMNSPVTQAKIVTAYNEGRIFSVPWVSDFGNKKIIPDQYSFCWILVEPADSKIYVGCGRYINYTGIGNWTVVYTK